jgi:hypothetical protein
LGTFTLNINNVNVPASIQKDPINIADVKNPEAKVNNLYAK